MKGELVMIVPEEILIEIQDEKGIGKGKFMRDKLFRFTSFFTIWGTSLSIIVFCIYVLLCQFGAIQ